MEEMRNKETILYIYLLLFIFLQSFSVHAVSDVSFKRLTTLDGLSQNDINCIYQDSRGFVWIGTMDGLNRYDGYEFKHFRISPGSMEGLSSNIVYDIDEDSNGNLWIGTTDQGLNFFDVTSQTFKVFKNTKNNPALLNSNAVTDLVFDAKGYIWIGNSKGINRIKLNSELNDIVSVRKFVPPTNTENSTPSITKLQIDSKGNLWICSNAGLFKCLNPYNEREPFRFAVSYNTCNNIVETEHGYYVSGGYIGYIGKENGDVDQNPLTINRVSNIYSSDIVYTNGELWVATRNGVRRFKCNTKNGQLKHLGWYKKDFSQNSLSSNVVVEIKSDYNGLIWAGTTGGGLTVMNPRKKQFKHFQHTPNEGSIPDNIFKGMFEDSQENLWMGFEQGGIGFLPSKHKKEYSTKVVRIDAEDGELIRKVTCFEEVVTPTKRSIWAGCGYPQLLVEIDPKTKAFKEKKDFFSKLGLVFKIGQANDSTVWLASYGQGLFRCTINTDGDIKNFHSYVNYPTDTNSIASNIIRSFEFDDYGNLWVGTDNGLSFLHKSKLYNNENHFINIGSGTDSLHLTHKYILPLFKDSRGQMWAGTLGGGVNYFTPTPNGKGIVFHKLTAEEGLPNNSIKTIVEDNKGLLWISSNRGLSSYNVKSKLIRNYDVSDGLQNYEFSEITGLKRKSGELLFGGVNGFNVFYPSEITHNNTSPKIAFTEFKVLNRAVLPGQAVNGRIVLKKNINTTQNLELKYSENSFSFEFAALHFVAPQKNTYRYRLVGFDDQPIKTTSQQRVANYTNIPPGKYTFVVEAMNSDGMLSKSPKVLNIHITSPPYLSNVAIAIYILLFIAFMYGLFYFFRWRASRKHELLLAHMETQQVEEMAQMKLRFFTNISHEFRTPLTLISAPVDTLLSEEKHLSVEQRKKHYSIIKQNINIMMRLVNQLLSFRKLEQKKLKLQATQGSMIELVDAVYNSFSGFAEKKNIHFNLVLDENVPEVWFDADKMEKVLYNLLSNAFKFTPENGEVNLGVTYLQIKQAVEITVEDTGSGIVESEKGFIFERYYQSKSKNKKEVGGTGIGLAFTKGLVELHKGEIFFESQENVGTTFHVLLPLGNEHLSKEEMHQGEVNIHEIVERFRGDISSDQETIQPSAISDIPEAKKSKLLVVEDNAELNTFLVEQLSDVYLVESAKDGEDGLDKINSFLPDVVVSDVMMPKLDGVEMTARIKKNELTSHIPILLLTAKSNIEAQVEGFEVGADAYVPKPFNLAVLKAQIQNLINQRNKLKERYNVDLEVTPSEVTATRLDQRFLQKILEIVEDNMNNPEFTIEQLAKDYGISRVNLNKKIKGLTGDTTVAFVRSIRLKRAAQLLLLKQNTVSEIAWEVGFSDLKYFRQCFQKQFGVNPSEYATSK